MQECRDLVLLCDGISGREGKTILIPFQILGFTATAVYLVYVAAELHHRNHRSWEAIVGRLSPAPSTVSRSWCNFRDAGVMMEVADYVAGNARGFDPEHLEEIRLNALAIRLGALRGLIYHSSK